MKKALLVGINKYAETEYNGLRGCINDVNGLVNLCTRRFEFSEVSVLTNKSATFDNVTRALTSLVDSSEAGDQILFYFSGHGAQVVDLNGDEDDKLDECIVTYDHSWDKPFVDDHLYSCIKNLHAEADLTLLVDACHSGGLVDFDDNERPDNRKTPKRKLRKTLPITEEQRIAIAKARHKQVPVLKFGVKSSDPKSQRHVLYAGCGVDSVSFERARRGLFTSTFCRYARLRRLRGASWTKVHRNVQHRTSHLSGKRQVPVLVGRSDLLAKPLFGSKLKGKGPGVRVNVIKKK